MIESATNSAATISILFFIVVVIIALIIKYEDSIDEDMDLHFNRRK